MNAPDEAQQWREMAEHLVEAHGAHSGGLIGYAPTLEQLRFAHADTHVALASIDALPPDRHTHPLPMDAGWCDVRESSYRPFPPSASARDDPFLSGWPMPYQTGPPQTYISPVTEADLADWAAVRPFADVSASGVKNNAASAAARWLARLSFPSPVQAWLSSQRDRGGLAASPWRPANAASVARQARPGSIR
jgi:hypothetical protein